MNKLDWDLLDNVRFKFYGYRKNTDIININDSFITEYDGTISEIRFEKRKPPRHIGDYSFSVWDIGLGKNFGVDFNKLMNEFAVDDLYNELNGVINKNEFEISDYRKIILVHTFIISPDYRKRGITEEFIEFLYRDFYNHDTAIIILVKPFQNNIINIDYYTKDKQVVVNESFDSKHSRYIPATEYYSLKKLMKMDDTELNEYKLFAVANRCGFQRINDSHLFIFSPEKIEDRMMEKHEYSQQIESE